MEYKSEKIIMGLPLIHVKTGEIVDGKFKRGVARGWIAIGNDAFGILFALGGVAKGGIAIGGIAMGGIAFGGLASGVIAIGSVGTGLIGIGGAGVGLIGIGGVGVGLISISRSGIVVLLACGGVVLSLLGFCPRIRNFMRP